MSADGLPCNLEAERAVLGAILIDSPNASTVFELLRPDDFFAPLDSRVCPHRIIFRAMLGMHTHQQAIDSLTLHDELARRDELEAAGGAAYLAQLLDGVPRITNVAQYARIIKEKGQLRRLAHAGEAIRLAALECDACSGDVLNKFSDYMSALAQTDGARRISDVEAETVEWLWPGRIPLSKLTMLDGDPGVGKSAVGLDIGARVTRGALMPDGTPGLRGGVVILSAEDGKADTIRPRLEAAGADLDQVVCIGCDEVPPLIPGELSRIEFAIRAVNAVLVVIDPVIAFIPIETNSWRDQDIRRALAPLARMAERAGAAVLLLRHLNKSAGGNPIYRGGGSIGIIGAARSALLIARDPDDPSVRVLAVTKCNLSSPAPSLSFQLEGSETGAVRVAWRGESRHGAGELLVQATGPEERSALDTARIFLRDVLAAGPVEAAEVRRQARRAAISERSLERAKFYEGVEARREGFGPGGRWVWALPKGASGGSKAANNPNSAAYEQVADTKPFISTSSSKAAKSPKLAPYVEGLALYDDRERGAAQGCATPTQPDCGCDSATVCPRCWLCPTHCHCHARRGDDGHR